MGRHTIISECCTLFGDVLEMEGKWGDGSWGLAKWMLLFLSSIYLVVRRQEHFGVTIYISEHYENISFIKLLWLVF